MNKFVDYCFHSHTYRCGHAKGDIEEYVKKAIANGFKYYGVSDHVFLPGIVQPRLRGDYSLLEEYIDVYNKVAKTYENKIQMYLSFECEYCRVFENYYRYLLKEKHFDYLICGQHMHFEDDKTSWWYLERGIDGVIEFKNDIIDVMKSGLFLYIAHPDMFFLKINEITPFIRGIVDEILDASLKYDVPLELNMQGLLRGDRGEDKGYFAYPCDFFWERAKEKGVKIVIGGDFHNPDVIGMKETTSQILDIVNKYDLKIMSAEEIISRINEMKKQYEN